MLLMYYCLYHQYLNMFFVHSKYNDVQSTCVDTKLNTCSFRYQLFESGLSEDGRRIVQTICQSGQYAGFFYDLFSHIWEIECIVQLSRENS